MGALATAVTSTLKILNMYFSSYYNAITYSYDYVLLQH